MDKQYLPVFAGQTEEGEKIVLYLRKGTTVELHILKPDGEFVPLGSGSQVTTWDVLDVDNRIYVQVESSVWSGRAFGTRRDLIEAEAR